MPSQDARPNPTSQPLSLAASQRLVHELRVHQIELEAQNEELRQVRMALETSWARFVNLYDLAPVGYCTVSANGLIEQANLTLAALLGVARGALITRPLTHFILPQDQDIFYAMRRRMLATPGPDACEARMAKSDGAILWAKFRATTAMGPDGKHELRLVVGDTTDRRQTEVALIESEKLLREAQTLAQLGSFVLDLRSGLWTSSHALDLIFGIDASYVRSVHGWEALIHPADRAMMSDYFRLHVLDQVSPFDKAYRIVRQTDQAERWVKGLAVLDFDGSGQAVQLKGTVQDITEQKRVEDQLRNLSRGLVQAQEQTRRRFSRELHDRTSPNLAALRINLDIIAQTPPHAHATPAFSDRLEDTRALIEDTTQSIREICAGLAPPALDRGGLLQVVQSYADQFSQRTGVAVQVRCADGSVRLRTDLEMALFRIVQEALTNCAKHARAQTVEIYLALDASPMWLAVTDDGRGFDTHPAPHAPRRSGQGLVNMRETAELAGAAFSLRSAPGAGTSIRVDLADGEVGLHA